MALFNVLKVSKLRLYRSMMAHSDSKNELLLKSKLQFLYRTKYTTKRMASFRNFTEMSCTILNEWC